MKTKMQLVDGPTLLTKFNGGKTTAKYPDKKAIFSQGEGANAIFYIEQGRVKLTVVSKRGKEAIIANLAVGDFFGEGCLANQTRRMASATAVSDCTIARIDKRAMIRVLQEDPAFSELFLAHVLSRNIRMEADLVDQLFNSSEKRLARVLLLLANFVKESKPDVVIAKISSITQAERIVGIPSIVALPTVAPGSRRLRRFLFRQLLRYRDSDQLLRAPATGPHVPDAKCLQRTARLLDPIRERLTEGLSSDQNVHAKRPRCPNIYAVQ